MRIELHGRVQGLGVRPAVARLAAECQLAGSVKNSTGGVSIHVEGRQAAIEAFRQELPDRLPEAARIETRWEEAAAPGNTASFRIEASASSGPLMARVPVDLAVCDHCLADVRAEGNRRRGYVLTTCTQCGPRYSLIEAMPYDRSATAMKHFTPCTQCGAEYARPDDRRFHSQTNGCAACGPEAWLRQHGGAIVARGSEAVLGAIEQLQCGRVVAVRGAGGYQLVVDATSALAVHELRRRKRRFGKPLAVMVANLAAADRLAVLGDAERQSLASPANPIVVVGLKQPSPLAAEVNESLDTIGIMLPTTPLHHELASRLGRPLVVTSGNLEGNPLAYDNAAAPRELAGVADAWLDHDRPIVRPIDDSVVRVIAGQAATIRLARGLAPLPLPLQTRPMLALGGHQKAAIAISNGYQSVLGPHVGDLETEATRAALSRPRDVNVRPVPCDAPVACLR